MRIVRAWRRFGVVLHREGGLVFTPDAFNRVVVQVNVRQLDVGVIAEFVGTNGKTVILGRNFRTACNQILYRMVQPPVAIVHFISRYTTGQR